MKIALAQLNYHIGNFEYNRNKIISALKKGKKEGADLVIFSELAVCGYPPKDLLEFSDFISDCESSISLIAKECEGIAAIVGSPAKNLNDKGKPLYNSAFFLAEGKIKYILNKTLLPSYDVFDEYRYFEPGKNMQTLQINNFNFALSVCEDLWNVGKHPLYSFCPIDELLKYSPNCIINIAASPFSYSHAVERKDVLAKNAVKYNLPIIYVNQVGAHTELLFDGGSLLMDSKGVIVDELNYFQEDFRIYDLNVIFNNANSKIKSIDSDSGISKIHDALIMGIKDYFNKSGFKKAVIGLSGGIDSAVTAVLAQKALGTENIKTVLLPSRFSSTHSKEDAVRLANNLGIEHDTIHIDNIYRSLENTLEPFFHDLPFNLTEENLQARIRGILLMALSNKFNYILLNTSNKSELAVGFGTLYGDMCGGLSVLGDLYKTQVFELAKFINKQKEIIPENILSKVPSAELRPDQKDSDTLPEYEVLDKILYQYIELEKSKMEIVKMGFEETLVKRIVSLVNNSEYKRYQFAPILRVSPKAFGAGRRMPIVAKFST